MEPPADPEHDRFAEGSADSERQRFAISALRSVELEAPERLRTRIETERQRARGPARRRRFALSGALAGAAAAAALALVLVLPGGAGGPSVVEAAELGERPATVAAPAASGPGLLDESNGGVPFPNWAKAFGWRATGERIDELEGRRAVTVFYEKDGRELAYTILDGEALAWPADWKRSVRAGTRFDHQSKADRLVVTWRQEGRTCVISGADVELAKLLELAAWETSA